MICYKFLEKGFKKALTIAMVRKCATERPPRDSLGIPDARNLQGAMAVFESLKKSGVELNSVIYNTVLDSCVECGDLAAAEQWMVETRKAHMADPTDP